MHDIPIRVEISAGELIDRISILEIKSERMEDAAKLANVRAELADLTALRDAALPVSEALADLAAELKAINQRLWGIEDHIRDCERRQDFGAAFVELARGVYFSNDARSAVKRRINELSGSAVVEEKSYTAY